MPISLNITQPTGAVATYHAVDTGSFSTSNGGSLIVSIDSYVTTGAEPLVTTKLDVTPLLASVPPTPPTGATVLQIVVGMIEQYLLTLPLFTGGTQVP